MIKTPFKYTGQGITRKFEGCVLVAYWDALGKVWTIGRGHTRGVKKGDVITQAQADAFEEQDEQEVVDGINRDCNWPGLTQHEFNALCDLAFNIGLHALEGSTLWRNTMAGDIAGAAAEFVKWDRADGKEIRGLFLRRLADRDEFLTEDNSNGTIPASPGSTAAVPPGNPAAAG